MKIKIRSFPLQSKKERGKMLIQGHVHNSAVNGLAKLKKGVKQLCPETEEETMSVLQIVHAEQE